MRQVAQLREALRLAQHKLDQNKDASKTQDLTNARDDGQLAVTDKLAPEPAWTGKDTAYVEAESAVRAAQRAVDDEITASETTKVPALQDAVIAAKAKQTKRQSDRDVSLPTDSALERGTR